MTWHDWRMQLFRVHQQGPCCLCRQNDFETHWSWQFAFAGHLRLHARSLYIVWGLCATWVTIFNPRHCRVVNERAACMGVGSLQQLYLDGCSSRMPCTTAS